MVDTWPLSGWKLHQVIDLFAATHECDFCHNEGVRYVHVLTHPGHSDIRVGCVCAGKLTGDEATSVAREKAVRNRAGRFAGWAADRQWTIESDRHTRAGRYMHWDYLLLVHRASEGWRWLMTYRQGKFRSPQSFSSADEAKWHFWSTQIEPEGQRD